MSADEILKNLGYEKVSDDKYSIEYRKILDDDLFEINFWKEDKTISKNYYRDMGYITLQELQAIEKIKWSIHISKLTKDINGSNASINVEVLKTVLSMLEEKDKIISLMLEKFADIDFDDMCLDCECCVGNGCIKEERDLYENCIKQYFENKAKELLNK